MFRIGMGAARWMPDGCQMDIFCLVLFLIIMMELVACLRCPSDSLPLIFYVTDTKTTPV